MKMYRVHDSMRDKLENIREALQTHLDLHEEFDTMPYDEACKLYRTLDQVENTCALASQKEVDGRTIKHLSEVIRKYDYLLAVPA